MARPTVRVELVFADCSAVLTKVLAIDKAGRECHLVVSREAGADEIWAGSEAGQRLRGLFDGDGLGAQGKNWPASGLLVARQGEGARFAADGSTVIRSTLEIAGDGTLALAGRLERVRKQVAILRASELAGELLLQAVEAARPATEAARCRDELRESRAKLAHFEAVGGEIEHLRLEIGVLEKQFREIGPQETAQTRVEAMGKTQLAQLAADREIAQCETRSRDALASHEAAKSRLGEIEKLRREQESDERALEVSGVALRGAEFGLETDKKAFDNAQNAVVDLERAVDQARRVAEAWRVCLAAYEAARALKVEKRGVEILRELGASLQAAQQAFEAAPKAPSWEELRAWHASWEQLKALENEAARGLQVEITPESANFLAWQADGKSLQNLQIAPGEAAKFAALSELILEIPGLGKVRVKTAARGLAELKDELEALRGQLTSALAPWKIELAALPEVLSGLEIRRHDWDEAERARRSAAEALRNEESRIGSLARAAARLAEREDELEAARAACVPFEGFFEMRNRSRVEVKKGCEEAENLLREAASRAARAKNEVATALQRLRAAEKEAANAAARPAALKAAIEARAAHIERLENDGLDGEARTELMEKLAAQLWSARRELESARAKRLEQGNGISAWHVEEARRAAVSLSEKRAATEKKLAELRRDLFHLCEQDAPAQIADLRPKIEVLEGQLARHEARLRGLMLLETALKIEGARLGRALAGPLNEKLSPWLSALRGKETLLEFDEAGSRIEAVLSREKTASGETLISLPFAAHSEGLKEQIAFALRLLLAGRVAGQLPSGRLPLVLDDPFTQSDAARRTGLGIVLGEATENLQILFVTCHAGHLGDVAANWIRLGDQNSRL